MRGLHAAGYPVGVLNPVLVARYRSRLEYQTDMSWYVGGSVMAATGDRFALLQFDTPPRCDGSRLRGEPYDG